MKKNSVKNERINAEMQKALSRILREDVKDPRMPLMFSVTRCVVAPDLKTCKAYISVLGSEEEKQDCLAALGSASGYVRRELAHQLNLRLTPEIRYIPDDSIEYGVEMSQKIDEVMDAQNEAVRQREEAESQAAAEAPEAEEAPGTD